MSESREVRIGWQSLEEPEYQPQITRLPIWPLLLDKSHTCWLGLALQCHQDAVIFVSVAIVVCIDKFCDFTLGLLGLSGTCRRAVHVARKKLEQ